MPALQDSNGVICQESLVAATPGGDNFTGIEFFPKIAIAWHGG
jgi:hypothetical protein